MTNEAQATSRGVGELLKANTTLMVWLVFLALGGGTLALYYAQIRYLPDIEWSSSIIYLAAASFIGGGVGLLLSLSVLLPGIIWADFLVFDAELSDVLCYDDDTGEPCMRSVSLYLGIPFGLTLLISHLALFLGVAWYAIVAVVLLVVTFFFMRCSFTCLTEPSSKLACEKSLQDLYKCTFKLLKPRKSKVRRGQDEGPKKRRLFKYAFWFTLSVLLNQISMLVIYRLSGSPTGWRFAGLTVICTFGVWLSNHVVAVRYHHHPGQAILASLMAASLLLFSADRFSSLSERIMTFYGFGERHKVNLLLTDKGAEIVENLGLPECIPTTPRVLCDVEILSKIGAEYYLRVGGRTFTLPKATVESYVSEQAAGNQQAIQKETP
jgi:hypothetical protein